jgi:hypothetical protein
MNIEGKISEALFFVSKMREKYNHRVEFKFYLSAFLSSARSITWVMKAEFGKVPFYKAWHDGRKLSEEETRVFKRINDLRVETNKIKPVRTRPIVATTVEVPPGLDYRKYLNQQITVNISAPDKDGKQTMSFVDKTTGETFTGPIEDYRIVNQLSDEDDLLELCENYMSIIEGIYSEWIDVIKAHLEKHVKNSGA